MSLVNRVNTCDRFISFLLFLLASFSGAGGTNKVAECADLPNLLDAGTGWSRKVGYCSNMCWESERNWLSYCCLLLYKHSNPSHLLTTIAELATRIPAYHATVDGRISNNKTLVLKKISSQFRLLVVELLQELERQGKRIQQQVIFIDGLGECAGEDASRNYRDHRILCQSKIHIIQLGYLRPHRASHRIHIQAGQHRLCHSL